MESKIKRDKMDIGDRAKQFMPFAAVVGLEEVLERKRWEMMRRERAVLSEEMQVALNDVLNMLDKGDCVTLHYYCDGEYITLYGEVKQINTVERWVCVSGKHVLFDDICSIDLIE